MPRPSPIAARKAAQEREARHTANVRAALSQYESAIADANDWFASHPNSCIEVEGAPLYARCVFSRGVLLELLGVKE